MTIRLNTKGARINSFNSLPLWITFLVYILILGFGMAHHELWGDELHSWNIAKGSNSFSDLISNTRYEGHPPVWYIVLWCLSKITHATGVIQFTHMVIASSVIFLVLFCSPFPLKIKALIPFGYYFLFEYAVLSRNYAIGILAAFLICIILNREFRFKNLLYYVILLVMTNTHLLALMLAGCFHIYFLIQHYEKNKKIKHLLFHTLLGILVALPALYFIFPPGDSELNAGYWISRWNIHQLKAFAQAPLWAFAPIPAWWKYNYWNTEVLLEAQSLHSWMRYINLMISAGFIYIGFFILNKERKSLRVFILNILLSFLIAVLVFPLTHARYAGFIFIGFIAALWLHYQFVPLSKFKERLVYILLFIQIFAGAFSVYKDIRLPFSNASSVGELLAKVPHGKRVTTDYWALNTVSAFIDTPFYCIDLGKERSFILWRRDLAEMLKDPARYTSGIKNFFKKENVTTVYLISTGSPETLFRLEPGLATSFDIKLIDKREGAIEKGGNLYLYKISALK